MNSVAGALAVAPELRKFKEEVYNGPNRRRMNSVAGLNWLSLRIRGNLKRKYIMNRTVAE